MRVAYFSPFPPERSGIADYSALLLPALRRRIRVDVVTRGGKRPPRGTDIALYHVGNDAEAHGWILRVLDEYPGLVVLHDFVLHHLVAGITLGRGDAQAYLRALEREGGAIGRLLGHAVLDNLVRPLWETQPEAWPLVSSVLERAQGLIVHSSYVARRAREAGYPGPIWQVPHPAWPIPEELPDPAVAEGRYPIIGCFGHLNRSKRVPQLLEAYTRVRTRHPGALLVLVGAVAPGLDLEASMERFDLRRGRDLTQLGYVDEPTLWSLMARSDVCVNLRSPTMGETSGTAIRALSLGRPLVVSDVGWFSELPDSVAAKVPADDWEVDTLSAYIDRLTTDHTLRERMSRAAAGYARGAHDLHRVAEAYSAALEEAAGGALVSDAVLREAGRAAAEVGLRATDAGVSELAARLREMGI